MLAAAREEGHAAIPPWTLHDLRRTFATGMVELHVPPHVVELFLALGWLRRHLQRSELLAEAKASLERWVTHVQGLVVPWPDSAWRESGGGSDGPAAEDPRGSEAPHKRRMHR
jgi:hypothetical protein